MTRLVVAIAIALLLGCAAAEAEPQLSLSKPLAVLNPHAAWQASLLVRGAAPARVVVRGQNGNRVASFTFNRRGTRYRGRIVFSHEGVWRLSARVAGRTRPLGRVVVGPAIVEAYRVALAADGALLIPAGGAGRGRVLRIDPASGRREIVPGTAGHGRVYDVAPVADGSLYLAVDGRVLRWRDGRTTTVVRDLADPTALAHAPDGSLYVSEAGRNRVVRIVDGVPVPVADGLEQPLGIAFGADGALYVCDSHRGRVVRVDGNGTLAPVASGLHLPASLHLAPDGSLLVVDHWHDREGSIARIGGGRLSDGKIFAPSGVAVATDGSTYVSTFSPEQPVGRLAADGSMQPLG